MPHKLTTEEAIAKFWSRCVPQDDGCWIWTGPKGRTEGSVMVFQRWLSARSLPGNPGNIFYKET
jgi:hypothetical protein